MVNNWIERVMIPAFDSRPRVSVAHLFFRLITIPCALTSASTGQQCILLVLFEI